MHKFGHFGLKFDNQNFQCQKTGKKNKNLPIISAISSNISRLTSKSFSYVSCFVEHLDIVKAMLPREFDQGKIIEVASCSIR